MNSIDALTQVDALLNRFAHFGVELGLERIDRLLAALGNPHQQVPILHVAGSNGKGSVCAYLSSVLTEAGCRVGCYTSPHLMSWCERMSLSGQDISAVELLDLLQQVVAAIDPNQSSPTQFEVITAVAWLYFAQQQVDIAVVEVGLGGRLDATNVCDRPLVSLITSLSREHWQRLGSTLAQIAYEKAGILKPGCPAVVAPQPAEAEAVVKQRLAELRCPAVWVQPSHDLGNSWAAYGSFRYRLPLLGSHQLINSAVAIAALQILQQQGWQISDEAIAMGMARTRWAGRLQWYDWQGQQILIDGAHNPAGAATLRNYLDRATNANVPTHWVMGMIANKDHADVFKALLRSGDSLYLVPVPEHLPVELKLLAELAGQTCPDLHYCGRYADVLAGLQAAKQAKEQGSAMVLCGSLYLIGYFFQLTQDLGSHGGA